MPFTANGANVGQIALTFLPAAFTIDFAGASNAWVSDMLLYNGTPTDLARIEYRAQGGGSGGVQSGYWLDDLVVTAIPEPSTILTWSLLAALGIFGWRRRK